MKKISNELAVDLYQDWCCIVHCTCGELVDQFGNNVEILTMEADVGLNMSSKGEGSLRLLRMGFSNWTIKARSV